MAKKPEKAAPCPFCDRPEVGLNCPNAECRRRIAKQADEPTPAVPSTGWNTSPGNGGHRKGSTRVLAHKQYHGGAVTDG